MEVRRTGTEVMCRTFGARFHCPSTPASRPGLLPTASSRLQSSGIRGEMVWLRPCCAVLFFFSPPDNISVARYRGAGEHREAGMDPGEELFDGAHHDRAERAATGFEAIFVARM